MLQLILHLLGDYVTQSDEMANRKTTSSKWALAHAITYSLPFALISSLNAWLVIFITHFFIDRFRLARYVCWAKNIVFGMWIKTLFALWWKVCSDEWNTAIREHRKDSETFSWENCRETGYPAVRPAWLAVWLLIACDNCLHLTLNYLAVKYL